MIELSNVPPSMECDPTKELKPACMQFIRGFLLRVLPLMRNVKRHHMTGNLTHPSAPATSVVKPIRFEWRLELTRVSETSAWVHSELLWSTESLAHQTKLRLRPLPRPLASHPCVLAAWARAVLWWYAAVMSASMSERIVLWTWPSKSQ